MSRISDTLYNLLNTYTKEYQTFTKVTQWVDGSSMDDSKCDGVVFRKAGTEYFKLDWAGPLDIKWFGAAGDGTTNDTDIINTAVAVAADVKLPLRFTKGQYLVRGTTTATTPVTISSPVIIIADADTAIVENQRHTVPLIQITNSKVVIQGLIIQGFETAADFDSTNSERYGIKATNCSNSVFERVTVSGKSRAIGLFSSNDCIVRDATVYGLFIDTPPLSAANFHNSVYISGGTRNKVINPVAFGVGNCVLVGANSSDGQILGGSVYTAYDNGIYVSSGLRWSVVAFNAVNPGGTGVKLRGDGNFAISCKVSGALVGYSITGNGPLNEWGSNGFGNGIKGCYAIDCGADGISLGGQDDGFAYGTVVEGCTVINPGTVDPSAYGAIRSGGENHRFVNNTFVDCTTEYAIVLGNTSKHLVISNNQFIGCKGGVQGVAIQNTDIVGNHFKTCGTNECIYLDGNCMNNYLNYNTTNDGFLGVYEIRVNQHASLINNNRIVLTNTNQYLISSEKNRVNQGNGEVFTVLPTADVTQRNRLATFLPVGGNPDLFYYCRRKADNTFEWVIVSTQYQGSGSPEGVVVGTVGDHYVNLTEDNGAIPKLFVKRSGIGTNTGWVGVAVVPTIRTAPGTAGVGMVPSDGTVMVNNTTTANAQLPNPALVTGRPFTIKKVSNNTTVLTVLPFATETIDGGAAGVGYDLANFNAWVTVQSDGTNWIVIASGREATATLNGLMSTGTQSFGGAKTFTSVTASTALLCSNANNNIYNPNQTQPTAVTNAAYLFGSAATVFMRTGLGGGNATATAGGNAYLAGVVIGKNTFTKASTGTHGVGTNLAVTIPTISGAGTAPLTNFSSFHVDGAPTGGTNNFAVYVAAGNSYFGGNIGLGQVAPSSAVDITGANGYTQLRLRTTYTPTSSADTNGAVGDVAWDDNYFYVKTSAGWKRSALSTF